MAVSCANTLPKSGFSGFRVKALHKIENSHEFSILHTALTIPYGSEVFTFFSNTKILF